MRRVSAVLAALTQASTPVRCLCVLFLLATVPAANGGSSRWAQLASTSRQAPALSHTALGTSPTPAPTATITSAGIGPAGSTISIFFPSAHEWYTAYWVDDGSILDAVNGSGCFGYGTQTLTCIIPTYALPGTHLISVQSAFHNDDYFLSFTAPGATPTGTVTPTPGTPTDTPTPAPPTATPTSTFTPSATPILPTGTPQRSIGDVYVGVGSARINHYDSVGHLVNILTAYRGGDYELGLCFDSIGNLYVSSSNNNITSQFDRTDQQIGSFLGGPSCTVDANDIFYLPQNRSVSTPLISKVQLPADHYEGFMDGLAFDENIQSMDMAPDQCTLYFLGGTTFGTTLHPTGTELTIERLNVCTQQLLAPFATSLPFPCGAIRLRPDSELFAACGSHVFRYSPYGTVVQTYTFSSSANMFSLDLDPDGTSFWSYDVASGTVYKVDIATGHVLTSFVAPLANPAAPYGGLAVYGAPRAAQVPLVPSATAAPIDWTATPVPTYTPQPGCAIPPMPTVPVGPHELTVTPSWEGPYDSIQVSISRDLQAETNFWPNGYWLTVDNNPGIETYAQGPISSSIQLAPYSSWTSGYHTVSLYQADYGVFGSTPIGPLVATGTFFSYSPVSCLPTSQSCTQVAVSPATGPPSATLQFVSSGCVFDWTGYEFMWDGRGQTKGAGGPPRSLSFTPVDILNTPGCHTVALIKNPDQMPFPTPVATAQYLITGGDASCATATGTATRSPTSAPTATSTPTATTSPSITSTSSPTSTPTSAPTSPASATATSAFTATTVAALERIPASPTTTPHPASPSHKQPSPQLLLRLSLSPRPVRSGHTLSVTVHTVAHAHIVTTLEVVTAKAVVVGKDKHRKRVMRLVVLYRKRMKGTAGAHGRLTQHVIVSYKPSNPTWAQLSVTATLGHQSHTTTARVLIQPLPRHPARRTH